MTKTFMLFGTLFFVSYFSTAQKKISVREASQHYGETVTICDKIYGIEFSESSKSLTAMQLGTASGTGKMFIFLSPDMLKKLTANGKTSITNRSICVTGKIRQMKGLPEIVVNKTDEIYLLNESVGLEIRPNDFMRFN